ncbi:nucleotide-binding protein [Microbacterium sp. zg.B48]|uniref:nucleotide-binding protein n=1 Tax=Microbacterium sp. zg.B48 TaxID=2969408 RepID=UPI00214CA0EE|nr:nucleotide-binding protein [Microbacterium sp. zg.B48]MCR2763807.1 nucleotide-binding protein [Microbacterium sp. zg.B48]
MTNTANAHHLPRVFIGSSSEALQVAKYLQRDLQQSQSCIPMVWDQGIFTASSYTLDSLVKTAEDSDFAVLIVTPDDFVARGDSGAPAPRDNVIFELGLFIAALGRDRTYIVVDRTDADIKLPTDVLGITYLPFTRHASANLAAALVGPALEIVERVAELGTRKGSATARSGGATSLSRAAIGVPGSHLEVFEVRTGRLWHRWSTDTGWSAWTEMPVLANLALEHVGAGAHGDWVDLFVSTTDGRLFHRGWGPDTGWSDWGEWHDSGVSGPLALASKASHENALWTNRDGGVHVQWFDGQTWSGWRPFA